MSEPFPSPLLTQRLIIRAPVPDDAHALTNAIQETFEDLHLWMPWAKSPQTLEESREVIDRMTSNWLPLRDYVLFCFDRQTSEFVLASGLHCIEPIVPSFHIGYWCRKSFQGQGYVTEAAKAIRDAGFDTVGAKRIEIRCDERNLASRAVAERCGFPLDAIMKNDCRDTQGNLSSTAYYALTRD